MKFVHNCINSKTSSFSATSTHYPPATKWWSFILHAYLVGSLLIVLLGSGTSTGGVFIEGKSLDASSSSQNLKPSHLKEEVLEGIAVDDHDPREFSSSSDHRHTRAISGVEGSSSGNDDDDNGSGHVNVKDAVVDENTDTEGNLESTAPISDESNSEELGGQEQHSNSPNYHQNLLLAKLRTIPSSLSSLATIKSSSNVFKNHQQQQQELQQEQQPQFPTFYVPQKSSSLRLLYPTSSIQGIRSRPGRADSNFIRFGRNNHNNNNGYLPLYYFGGDVAEGGGLGGSRELRSAASGAAAGINYSNNKKNNFIRLGRENPRQSNFIRLGRENPRQNNFIRLGRNYNPSNKHGQVNDAVDGHVQHDDDDELPVDSHPTSTANNDKMLIDKKALSTSMLNHGHGEGDGRNPIKTIGFFPSLSSSSFLPTTTYHHPYKYNFGSFSSSLPNSYYSSYYWGPSQFVGRSTKQLVERSQLSPSLLHHDPVYYNN